MRTMVDTGRMHRRLARTMGREREQMRERGRGGGARERERVNERESESERETVNERERRGWKRPTQQTKEGGLAERRVRRREGATVF